MSTDNTDCESPTTPPGKWSLVDEPTTKELIEDVFNISGSVCRVYLYLVHQPEPQTVRSIASELDRNRSSISRSLTQLYEKGLITREEKSLKTGGHKYVYDPLPMAQLRVRMHEALDHWTEQMHREIDKTDERSLPDPCHRVSP